MKILSDSVYDSNDENNFPHELLLTKIQVLKFPKCFPNNSSANYQKLNYIKYDNLEDF